MTLAEFELEERAFEINKLSVELAREAAESFADGHSDGGHSPGASIRRVRGGVRSDMVVSGLRCSSEDLARSLRGPSGRCIGAGRGDWIGRHSGALYFLAFLLEHPSKVKAEQIQFAVLQSGAPADEYGASDGHLPTLLFSARVFPRRTGQH